MSMFLRVAFMKAGYNTKLLKNSVFDN